MIESERRIADTMASIVARLDAEVMNRWGFVFEADGIHTSHTGPYASGHYTRGGTRIGLSCRETIDNIYYEHSFIEQNPFSTAIERFTIGHDALMNSLGHTDDCHLVCSDRIPDAVVARDGGDRVAALLHDWTTIAAPVLRERCEAFFSIVRQGWRAYSIC